MLWPFLTLASAAAASYAGYSAMAPQSQLYGRTLTHGSDSSQMALTFDDGPNDPHTLRLLDVLVAHQAKATFFLIGKYVRQRPEIARAILAAGHEIGNHTYSHPNLIFASAGRLRQELDDCGKTLEDALGSPVRLFRPPFGGRRPNVLRTARTLGLAPHSAVGDCSPARWRTSGLRRRSRSHRRSHAAIAGALPQQTVRHYLRTAAGWRSFQRLMVPSAT